MTKEIPTKVKHILEELKVELHSLYKDRLKDVILYGSFARGDYKEGSDIDIVILLDGMNNFKAERQRYFSIISKMSLDNDVVISAIPFDYKEYQDKATPLTLNVKQEGVYI